MADPATHTIEPRQSLLRNYSFHFLWSSTFASGLADRLAMLAVAVMLGYGAAAKIIPEDQRLADSSINAAIQFWFFLPYVLWGPFAGWLADRLPRKWLMFVSDEARGLLILFAYLLLPSGTEGAITSIYDTWFTLGPIELTHTWKIWLLMFAIGTFAATFSPARNSVIPNVVGYRVLQRANSMVVGMGVIGNLIGFAVGGPLAEYALRYCILASSICYLVFGWMWPFLKTPVRRHDSPGMKTKPGPKWVIHEVIEGGRYILRHRPLVSLVAVGIMFWSGSQIVLGAGSAIAVDLYGGKMKEFALIGGGFGFGMLLGAALLGWINSRRGGELIIVVGMIGTAIFLSLLVVVPNKWVGFVLSILCGGFGGALMITINTLTQMLTADGFRGRVMGFKDLACDLGSVIVTLIIWRMAQADRYILYAAHLFSALLIATAVYGYFRYVARGPAEGRIANTFLRIGRLYATAMHRLKIRGAHYMPRTGPVLLVSNHRCGVDPLFIQVALQRPVRFLMASNYKIGLLAWFWRIVKPVSVKRDGNDHSALRSAIDLLKQGEVVGIFPEGGYHYGDDETADFHKGVGLIARRSGASILPVNVARTPRTEKVSSAYFTSSHSVVTFGPVIGLDELTADLVPQDDRDRQIAQRLRQRILALNPDTDKPSAAS